MVEFLRRKWHLGERPIESTMQLVESKGVRVFSLPADAVSANAFSMWRRDQPFVFLDTTKRDDELRFDLALELGHLLLHRQGAPASHKALQVAAAFASALLMPAASMRNEARPPLGIGQLMSLAGKWRTPPPVLAHRLRKLELLWQYRMLRDHIAAQRQADHAGRVDARFVHASLHHRVLGGPVAAEPPRDCAVYLASRVARTQSVHRSLRQLPINLAGGNRTLPHLRHRGQTLALATMTKRAHHPQHPH